MPSWNALPFELKSLIFDHLLESVLQINHGRDDSCAEWFPSIYIRSIWYTGTTQLTASNTLFLLKDLQLISGRHPYAAFSLRACLFRTIKQGWITIKKFLNLAPKLTATVRARFNKELRAMQASFRRDCRRFVYEVRDELDERARAKDAEDGLRKEVMKGLCCRARGLPKDEYAEVGETGRAEALRISR